MWCARAVPAATGRDSPTHQGARTTSSARRSRFRGCSAGRRRLRVNIEGPLRDRQGDDRRARALGDVWNPRAVLVRGLVPGHGPCQRLLPPASASRSGRALCASHLPACVQVRLGAAQAPGRRELRGAAGVLWGGGADPVRGAGGPAPTVGVRHAGSPGSCAQAGRGALLPVDSRTTSWQGSSWTPASGCPSMA